MRHLCNLEAHRNEISIHNISNEYPCFVFMTLTMALKKFFFFKEINKTEKLPVCSLIKYNNARKYERGFRVLSALKRKVFFTQLNLVNVAYM